MFHKAKSKTNFSSQLHFESEKKKKILKKIYRMIFSIQTSSKRILQQNLRINNTKGVAQVTLIANCIVNMTPTSNKFKSMHKAKLFCKFKCTVKLICVCVLIIFFKMRIIFYGIFYCSATFKFCSTARLGLTE